MRVTDSRQEQWWRPLCRRADSRLGGVLAGDSPPLAGDAGRTATGIGPAGLTGALLLALAGCGGDGDKQAYTAADGSTATVTTTKSGDTGAAATITGTDAKGNTATMVAGAGARWPEAAPAYVPAYPGANVETSMAGTADGKAGGMVSFKTGDAPQQVVDFYRDKAKAAGMDDVNTMDVNGAKLFTAADKAGHALSVQASTGEDGTSAAVTYGQR